MGVFYIVVGAFMKFFKTKSKWSRYMLHVDVQLYTAVCFC